MKGKALARILKALKWILLTLITAYIAACVGLISIYLFDKFFM